MIDENEAPDGYIAVEWNGDCDKCALFSFACEENEIKCMSRLRNDGETVKFIKKWEQTK